MYNEFEGSDLNINALDNDQTTPLMEATYNDNVSVVKFLLENGVEVYHDDKDGTALTSRNIKIIIVVLSCWKNTKKKKQT